MRSSLLQLLALSVAIAPALAAQRPDDWHRADPGLPAVAEAASGGSRR